jgi:predicted ester cyclase
MSDSTMSDANKTLLRTLCAASDRGDLATLADIMAPGALDHDPAGGAFPGVAALPVVTAPPGEQSSYLAAVISDGDRVAAVRRIHPLNGGRADSTAITWLRIASDRVAEHWGLLDTPAIQARLRGRGDYTAIPTQRTGDRMVPLGSASSTEENKSFMRSAMEMLDSGEYATFCALVDGHCVNHGASGGRRGWVRRLTWLREAFSDAEFVVLDQLAESDLVSGRYEFSARHTGDFAGIKPTGRAVSATAMDMARIRDGQIVEHWLVADVPSLLEQLA